MHRSQFALAGHNKHQYTGGILSSAKPSVRTDRSPFNGHVVRSSQDKVSVCRIHLSESTMELLNQHFFGVGLVSSAFQLIDKSTNLINFVPELLFGEH
mmetsp:Transcript_4100/g.15443  ORF Transcript_4100/g.15443 Transcript_4100/m.15443 type:complete len:98 (+) Transcript_4100:3123-3416(+)